jgi:hypothetical protein
LFVAAATCRLIINSVSASLLSEEDEDQGLPGFAHETLIDPDARTLGYDLENGEVERIVMRDPHVEWLEYELKAGWLFADPPPVNWETAVFQAKLDRGVLRANLREHFATEAEARAAVEPFLQTWEIDVALAHGGREITFPFKQSHVVDRDPPPPPPTGVAVITTGVGLSIQAGQSTSATGQVILKTYPPAPSDFVAVPDVVTLWTRFEGFTKGREPLASMAYFCFSVLKFRYGGRVKTASKALAVDEDVLRKLSELSTNRGEPSTARKMTRHLAPITATEAHWLSMPPSER